MKWLRLAADRQEIAGAGENVSNDADEAMRSISSLKFKVDSFAV